MMELLVVVAIIGILAALATAALAGATQSARAQRTRAIVAKLDALIGEKWESYRTRTVPVYITPGTNPRAAATIRLNGLRELQRMELPDRVTDVADANALRGSVVVPIGSLQRAYFRMAQRSTGGNVTNWTTQHQGSECLYLILSAMRDGDKSAVDFLTREEVGDVDQDGMKEVLDGWGRPIEFLRWAPGFRNDPGPDGGWGIAGTDDNSDGIIDDFGELGAVGSDDIVRLTTQSRGNPDPFDPVKIYPNSFALRPLIFSAGADKSYDVNVEGGLVYTATTPPNNPYYTSGSSTQAGQVLDADGDGYQGWMDNITNHFQEAE